MVGRIADDFSDDIKEIARELYNTDDRAAQRRIHYLLSESKDPPRGLFKLGSKVCMVRSVLRADLERRARGGEDQVTEE
jgi:hypothetical protein